MAPPKLPSRNEFNVKGCAKSLARFLVLNGEVEKLQQLQGILRDCPREVDSVLDQSRVSAERRRAAQAVFDEMFSDDPSSASTSAGGEATMRSPEVITIDSAEDDSSDTDSHSSSPGFWSCSNILPSSNFRFADSTGQEEYEERQFQEDIIENDNEDVQIIEPEDQPMDDREDHDEDADGANFVDDPGMEEHARSLQDVTNKIGNDGVQGIEPEDRPMDEREDHDEDADGANFVDDPGMEEHARSLQDVTNKKNNDGVQIIEPEDRPMDELEDHDEDADMEEHEGRLQEERIVVVSEETTQNNAQDCFVLPIYPGRRWSPEILSPTKSLSDHELDALLEESSSDDCGEDDEEGHQRKSQPKRTVKRRKLEDYADEMGGEEFRGADLPDNKKSSCQDNATAQASTRKRNFRPRLQDYIDEDEEEDEDRLESLVADFDRVNQMLQTKRRTRDDSYANFFPETEHDISVSDGEMPQEDEERAEILEKESANTTNDDTRTQVVSPQIDEDLEKDDEENDDEEIVVKPRKAREFMGRGGGSTEEPIRYKRKKAAVVKNQVQESSDSAGSDGEGYDDSEEEKRRSFRKEMRKIRKEHQELMSGLYSSDEDVNYKAEEDELEDENEKDDEGIEGEEVEDEEDDDGIEEEDLEEEEVENEEDEGMSVQIEDVDGRQKPKKHRRSLYSSDDSDEDEEWIAEDVVGRPKKRKRRGHCTSDDSDSDSQRRINEPKQKRRKLTAEDAGRNEVCWEDQIRSRKIMSDDKLAKSTLEAERKEAERRRRLEDKASAGDVSLESVDRAAVAEPFVLDADLNGDPPEPVVVSEHLALVLKPHQQEGIRFLYNSTIESLDRLNEPGGGGILAHCMGLGKTFQVIAFLHSILLHSKIEKVIRRVLIVVPANVIINWESEFNKWLSLCGEQRIEIFRFNAGCTSMRRRLQFLQKWTESSKPSVFIIGYQMFRDITIPRKNASKDEVSRVKCAEIIASPHLVVCDEAHALKSDKTKMYFAMTQLKTTRRLCLTGTPMQNNLNEYYFMIGFVKPNLLGSVKEFANRYKNPIENGSQKDSTPGEVRLMKKQAYLLHNHTKCCINRRDHKILFESLAPKLEYVIEVKMSPKQWDVYKVFVRHMKGIGLDLRKGGFNLVTNYIRSLLITAHPYQIIRAAEKSAVDAVQPENSEESDECESFGEETVQTFIEKAKELMTEEDKNDYELSGKLAVLIQLIKKSEQIGDKMLVFSQSIETLELIKRMLKYHRKNRTWFVDGHLGDYGKRKWSWTEEEDFACITGNTNLQLRKQYQDLFNDVENPRLRLMLVSTKAGCLGTNLIGANRVVIFDVALNPALDAQALFRVCRYGQTKPTYIYRLLAHRSLETTVYKRQVKKLSTSKRVVDKAALLNHFKASELYLEQEEELEPVQHNVSSEELPKDRLLASLIESDRQLPVHTWLEHESLFNHNPDEELTEQEKQSYLVDYENELQQKWERQQASIENVNAGQMQDPNLPSTSTA